jgi:flagellar biogenesis protein FliO
VLQAAPSSPPPDAGGYGWFLFETLLILALVCLGAWLVIRFGVKRLYPGVGARGGPLRLVARLPLEPRRTLYIVEAGKKMFLVGTGEQGSLTNLGELDPREVEAAEAMAPAPHRSFLDLLRKKDPPKA